MKTFYFTDDENNILQVENFKGTIENFKNIYYDWASNLKDGDTDELGYYDTLAKHTNCTINEIEISLKLL